MTVHKMIQIVTDTLNPDNSLAIEPFFSHFYRYSLKIEIKMKTIDCKNLNYFLIAEPNIYCGYSKESLNETVLLSTHNICFVKYISRIIQKVAHFFWKHVFYTSFYYQDININVVFFLTLKVPITIAEFTIFVKSILIYEELRLDFASR